jgi:PAS domain S-box-containing protein
MDALMLLDEKGFFDCNKATLGLFGCRSVEAFTKLHPADLSPPTQPDGTPSMDAAMSHIQKAFQTGTDHFFWIHKRTGGAAFPADVLLTRMPLKGREVLQATVREITERKQQEREVESLAKFPYENPNPVFRIDGKGVILYSNEAGAFLLNDWNIKVDGRAPERIRKIAIDALRCNKRIELEETCDAKTFSLLFVPFALEGYVNVYANDITESKKTEASLKEIKDQLELQVKRMPIGCIVWDADFKVVSWNPAAEAIFGYAAKDIIGKHSYGTIVPKEAQSVVEKIWRRLLEGDESASSVNDNLTKDGKLICCSWSNTPLKREDNSVIGVLSMVQDITERKRAEKELNMFALAIQKSTDGIAIGDLNGNITFVNDALLELRGSKDKNDLMGKHVLELIAERDRPRVIQNSLECVRTGKAFVGQYAALRADGFELQVEVATSRIDDDKGQGVGFIDIIRNVSDRLKAEESVRQSEEKFRTLAEESPNVIFINKRGRVVYANMKCEDISGYTREELYSSNFNFLSLCAPECVESVKSFYSLHLRGEDVPPYEFVLVSKDGRRIDVINSSKLMDFEGDKAILGIITDISELKKAEKDLNQIMDQLVSANEKLNVVGSLTRHDARNKLSVITGNIYLLKKKYAENPEIRDRLCQIEQACRSVAKIFDFAKLYEQIGVEELIFVDVEKTIDEAVALFSSLPDVKIANECDGLTVLADSFLRQLYYNLIDNSIKHGQHVTNIRMHYENADQNNLKLIYEDDGVGVPAQIKPQLFQEGFSTGGGTGLGLFLIKKMMDVYGWQIQENGTLGEGAKFTITIPKLNKNRKENYQIAQ